MTMRWLVIGAAVWLILGIRAVVRISRVNYGVRLRTYAEHFLLAPLLLPVEVLLMPLGWSHEGWAVRRRLHLHLGWYWLPADWHDKRVREEKRQGR